MVILIGIKQYDQKMSTDSIDENCNKIDVEQDIESAYHLLVLII